MHIQYALVFIKKIVHANNIIACCKLPYNFVYFHIHLHSFSCALFQYVPIFINKIVCKLPNNLVYFHIQYSSISWIHFLAHHFNMLLFLWIKLCFLTVSPLAASIHIIFFIFTFTLFDFLNQLSCTPFQYALPFYDQNCVCKRYQRSLQASK